MWLPCPTQKSAERGWSPTENWAGQANSKTHQGIDKRILFNINRYLGKITNLARNVRAKILMIRQRLTTFMLCETISHFHSDWISYIVVPI